jgi:hypothetical protein
MESKRIINVKFAEAKVQEIYKSIDGFEFSELAFNQMLKII